MHGWYPESRPLDRPERLFDVSMAHLRDLLYWVTTDRQAAFLRGLGFSHATPLGLPLAYVEEPRIAREEGSLLVMPAHSLPGNDRAWATSDYVDAIRALKPAFRRICVCVNGHDWSRGNWVHEFRGAGFEVIRGAGDDSSLERMADLFTQFESVTTNGFGSLIAYASAFGARASFYGPFSEVTPDTLKNVPFFIDNPELMAPESRCSEESYCREMFPEFFCDPADAKERIEWGRTEIGWEHKVPADELRDLFGWSTLGQVRSMVKCLAVRLQGAVPDPLKAELRSALTPEGASTRRERRRLASIAADVPGTTPLFGAAFEFADARAYLDAYDAWFMRHAYRFRATSDQPLVIDANADIGLGVLYVKCLYPRSRILALEADPAAFGILERNRRTYGLEDVELVHDALGGDVATRALSGRLQGGDGKDAPAAAGRPFAPATGGGSPGELIDLLRLRVDAAQPGIVRELPALLAHAESVAVDYYARAGEPQDLSAVFAVVQGAGFRIAVQSPDSAKERPLVEIPSSGESGAHVRVLGFRT